MPRLIVDILVVYMLRVFLGSLIVFFFAKYSSPADFSIVALAFTLGALLHVVQDWGLYYSVAESWKSQKKFLLKSIGLFRVKLFISVGGAGAIIFISLLGWVGGVFWAGFMLQSACVYMGYYYRLSGELNKERNGLVLGVLFFVVVFWCAVSWGLLSIVSFSLILLCSRLIQFLVVLKGFPFIRLRFFTVGNIFNGSRVSFWKYFADYGLPMFLGAFFILIDSLLVNYFVPSESAAIYQYGYRFVALSIVFLEILVFLFYSKMDVNGPIFRGGVGLYLGGCGIFLFGSFLFFFYFYEYGSCVLFGGVYCQVGQWGMSVFLIIFFKVVMSIGSVFMLVYRSGWLRVIPGAVGVVLLFVFLLFFMNDEGGLGLFYNSVLAANFFAACFSLFLFLGLALKKGVRLV